MNGGDSVKGLDNEASTVVSKKIVINKDAMSKKKRKIEVISGSSKSNAGV